MEEGRLVIEYKGREATKREQQFAAAGAKSMLQCLLGAMPDDVRTVARQIFRDFCRYAIVDAISLGEVDAKDINELSTTMLAKYSHDIAQKEGIVVPGAVAGAKLRLVEDKE